MNKYTIVIVIFLVSLLMINIFFKAEKKPNMCEGCKILKEYRESLKGQKILKEIKESLK